MELRDFFRENPKAALGFSGGVDSSYLLYEGLRLGADIKAYFVKTAFQPEFELHDAERLALDIGADFSVIEADILANGAVAANPPDRCYRCKRVIFETLRNQADIDGYSLLIDGSNASDDAADRPGMRALGELSVRSPLRECGLSKSDIRLLSKDAGLFTWDKPSYSCLATRIPTGREITNELLERIERAENALFTLGFVDFRVRVAGGAARLQLTPGQMEMAMQKRERILSAIRPHFNEVFLDMECRKGE